MTYQNHPLTEAARYNDARAEEHGMEKAVIDSGLELGALMHIATQRAMRLVIMTSRGPAALKQMTSALKPTAAPMSPAENAMMERFTLAYLDGILIGWSGRELNDKADA